MRQLAGQSACQLARPRLLARAVSPARAAYTLAPARLPLAAAAAAVGAGLRAPCAHAAARVSARVRARVRECANERVRAVALAPSSLRDPHIRARPSGFRAVQLPPKVSVPCCAPCARASARASERASA
eukprot:3702721-Pleurochrysis_carterae.AAC.1